MIHTPDHGQIPVSYTHLDVLALVDALVLADVLALVDALVLADVLALVDALVLADVLALVDALVPVSYTHLTIRRVCYFNSSIHL